jgi:hypothetical protein
MTRLCVIFAYLRKFARTPGPRSPRGQGTLKRLDARGNRAGCTRALTAAKRMYNLQ